MENHCAYRFTDCFLLLSFALLLFSCQQQSVREQWLITAPAGNRYCHIDTSGETILPNGRIIRPAGHTFRIAPHPYGLVLSADGQIAVTANSGTSPFSISIIEHPLSERPVVYQIPEGAETDNALLGAVFMGLAISPNYQVVYVAGGQQNKIFIFDIATRQKTGVIDCSRSFDGTNYDDGYIGDLVLSKDGSRLYAVDQIGFRVVIIDTRSRQVIANVKTGRYPFGIALSPDEKNLYVANVGMFEYSYVQTLDSNRLKATALKYPAFAFGSKAMKEGIQTDSVKVRGLGDPNVPESFSVWRISLQGRPVVKAKIKTGILVGEKLDGIPAVGGSSPNSLVVTSKYVFVSNGNNDDISVIDAKQDIVLNNISLQPDARLGHWKGVIPFGLALSPDQRRLYVAESGINAVGVVDIPTRKVVGHLPAGWFPSKLRVSPDGKKLVIANAKGYGSGPNGGATFNPGPEGSYIGNLMKGSVTVMDIPDDAQLKAFTTQVIRNNFRFEKAEKSLRPPSHPLPRFPGDPATPIKYIVFISKENLTYDEVFGQVRKGNGDPSLARFGMNARVVNRAKTRQVDKATIMPNHLKLAERFSSSDNFYVDADHSADGHRWLTNTYPNEWLETNISAAYGGKREIKKYSSAPGRFGMTGASGAIYPEDYNQHGSMWDHLYRNGKEFYNFGFGVEFDQGSFADSTFKYGGVRYLVNYPLPGPLYDRTSHLFPTFNMAIPDQFRAAIFIKEVKEKWLNAKKDLPPVLTLQLLNDHGAAERPHAGFPFLESYMSDNDLALGRVVEFLSHTPYWKNMLIVVTEDDSQSGADHIDAHRSILLLISPYAKKNYVGHQHYSFGSIFKTFWNILGIPYLNQYDAGATDLGDLFTGSPDFAPYNALPVDRRVFDPEKALTPIDEKFDWQALKDSPDLDEEGFLVQSRKEADSKQKETKEILANQRSRKKRS